MNIENLKIAHLKTHNQNLESWVAIINGEEIIGHIYMLREEGQKLKFLDAWVHSDYRRKGVYRKLWEKRWEYVTKEYKGYTVYAWCKEKSLPLLLEKGFESGEIVTYVEKEIN
jgi:GNAT superfamily N-acetyltransferase